MRRPLLCAEERNSLPPSRAEAFKLGTRWYFTGEQCVRGHLSEKYSSNGKCAACIREDQPKVSARVRAWRLKNPSSRTEEGRKYRAKRPEVGRAAALRYRHKNIIKIRAQQAQAKWLWRRERPDEYAELTKRIKKVRIKKQESVAGRPKTDFCEICGRTGKIVFDHCHATGVFRGWLCDSCNRALGMAEDSAVILRKMADYLDRFNETHGSQAASHAVESVRYPEQEGLSAF